MKNYIKHTCAALCLMSLTASCGDFGDTNIDPEHMNDTNVPLEMVFTNAQHQALGSDWDAWRNGLIYLSQWNQHIASGGWWWSYGVNAYNNDYSAAYWASVYSSKERGAVRDINWTMERWKDDPKMANDYQLARITRAYIFHRLTDLYGDIPYTEASQPNKYPYPKYDKQEDIYTDLLKELDEAQAALTSGTAKVGTHDLYYNGDLAKWKKFANSLMLRMAMRLTKVNPEKAKEYVAKAYANGVITSTDDNCLLRHIGGSPNNDSSEPYAKIVAHEDPGIAFISRTLLDKLRSLHDPRIPLIMAVYPVNYKTKDINPAIAANSAPDKQKGIPNSFSMTKDSKYVISQYYPEFTEDVLTEDSPNYFKKTHSQPNRSTYADPQAPTFICTAAQTNLLLAEAAHRGWISGDAANFYRQGVRCAMEQFAEFPHQGAKVLYGMYLNDAAIDKYLEQNPFRADKAMELINTQYWITCFFDEYETYANWRRTNIPQLEMPAKKHTNFNDLGNYGPDIVRRFPYPSSELLINPANYKEALHRMGLEKENQFNASRVWWDKK